VDPDGNDFYNLTERDITVKLENTSEDGYDYVVVRPGEVFRGKIDGVFINNSDDGPILKVSDHKKMVGTVHVVIETDKDGNDIVSFVGKGSVNVNNFCDFVKSVGNLLRDINIFRYIFKDILKSILKDKFKEKNDLLSGIYEQGKVGYTQLDNDWRKAGNKEIKVGGDKIEDSDREFLDSSYKKQIGVID
jgi:hypothetical protein